MCKEFSEREPLTRVVTGHCPCQKGWSGLMFDWWQEINPCLADVQMIASLVLQVAPIPREFVKLLRNSDHGKFLIIRWCLEPRSIRLTIFRWSFIKKKKSTPHLRLWLTSFVTLVDLERKSFLFWRLRWKKTLSYSLDCDSSVTTHFTHLKPEK